MTQGETWKRWCPAAYFSFHLFHFIFFPFYSYFDFGLQCMENIYGFFFISCASWHLDTVFICLSSLQADSVYEEVRYASASEIQSRRQFVQGVRKNEPHILLGNAGSY